MAAQGARSPRRPPMLRRAIAVGPFLTAVVAWAIGIWRRSPWTDEFHTLYHARAHTLLGFLESVRTDNHPPLGFLLAWVGRVAIGESELALRLPSLVATLFLLGAPRAPAPMSSEAHEL